MRQWKLVGLVYLLQLVIGLVIGGKLYLLINDKLGHTGAMVEFKEGWNYSAVHDFLFNYGRELSEIKSQFAFLLLAYIVLTAFISAGLWQSLSKAERSLAEFWSGLKSHWGKFLGLGLISILLMVVISVAIWMPYGIKVMHWLEYKPDERFIVYVGMVLLILWAMLLSILFSWSYLVKSHFINDELGFGSGLKKGLKSLWSKLRSVLPTVLFYAFLSLLLLYISVVFEAGVGITTSGLIVLAIVVQQVIVWSKIVLRVSLISYFLNLLKD